MRQGEVTFVANRISGFFKRCFPVSAGDCLKTLFGLFLATASCIILRELNSGDDYMAAVQVIYVLAAFMIARFTQGFLYGTFAAVAGVLLTNFIFTYPYWAFNFTLPGYPVTILCALIVSVTTSTMTARIKEQGQLQLEAEREKMRILPARNTPPDAFISALFWLWRSAVRTRANSSLVPKGFVI